MFCDFGHGSTHGITYTVQCMLKTVTDLDGLFLWMGLNHYLHHLCYPIGKKSGKNRDGKHAKVRWRDVSRCASFAKISIMSGLRVCEVEKIVSVCHYWEQEGMRSIHLCSVGFIRPTQYCLLFNHVNPSIPISGMSAAAEIVIDYQSNIADIVADLQAPDTLQCDVLRTCTAVPHHQWSIIIQFTDQHPKTAER